MGLWHGLLLTIPRNDPDQLSSFVGMPIRPSTRSEHDRCYGICFVIMERREEDISRKAVIGTFGGFDVGGCGIVAEDRCCRHCDDMC